jgi:hypothetical protein
MDLAYRNQGRDRADAHLRAAPMDLTQEQRRDFTRLVRKADLSARETHLRKRMLDVFLREIEETVLDADPVGRWSAIGRAKIKGGPGDAGPALECSDCR